MLLGLRIGLLSFVLFFISHILYFLRFSPYNRAKIFMQLLKIFVLFQIIVLIMLFFIDFQLPIVILQGGIGLSIAWSMLTFFSLFVLYMPFYYTISASLSIETLILLRNTTAQKLNISRLKDKFISESLVEKRLQTMEKNNYLVYKDGFFYLSAKGKKIATFFSMLKKFWKLGDGG